jgi:hypothetical protein
MYLLERVLVIVAMPSSKAFRSTQRAAAWHCPLLSLALRTKQRDSAWDLSDD